MGYPPKEGRLGFWETFAQQILGRPYKHFAYNPNIRLTAGEELRQLRINKISEELKFNVGVTGLSLLAIGLIYVFVKMGP